MPDTFERHPLLSLDNPRLGNHRQASVSGILGMFQYRLPAHRHTTDRGFPGDRNGACDHSDDCCGHQHLTITSTVQNAHLLRHIVLQFGGVLYPVCPYT